MKDLKVWKFQIQESLNYLIIIILTQHPIEAQGLRTDCCTYAHLSPGSTECSQFNGDT